MNLRIKDCGCRIWIKSKTFSERCQYHSELEHQLNGAKRYLDIKSKAERRLLDGRNKAERLVDEMYRLFEKMDRASESEFSEDRILDKIRTWIDKGLKLKSESKL